jgi:hypothetical protein
MPINSGHGVTFGLTMEPGLSGKIGICAGVAVASFAYGLGCAAPVHAQAGGSAMRGTSPHGYVASEAAPPPAAKVEVGVKFTGFVGIAASPTVGALTFGGPRLELSVGDFGFALSFYPSLVYSDRYDSGRVRPLLGAGPALRYRFLVLFMPVYRIEPSYVTAPGIGFQF